MTISRLLKQNINIIKSNKTSNDIEVFYIDKSEITEAVDVLKQDFNLLISLFGVDKIDHFEVVYHLYSIESKKNIILKCVLDKDNPAILSISSIYKSANWHERETYDLFGIKFLNHPNLTRLLLPKDWIGHPLRKDYVLEDKRLAWNER